MSKLIVIIGDSGTGKTTSMRNLDPSKTCIISVLNKELPLRNARSIYNKDLSNFMVTDSDEMIVKALWKISESRPEINTIIIDDLSFVMNNEYMRRAKDKNPFEKYVDMGLMMHNIMEACMNLRDDICCFVMSHTEKVDGDVISMQTVGKATTNYVQIPGRSTATFHSRVVNMEYKFQTNSDGMYLAHTPMGMFKDMFIDNDLAQIRLVIDEFYDGHVINEGEEE